jgi:hypothetical protein
VIRQILQPKEKAIRAALIIGALSFPAFNTAASAQSTYTIGGTASGIPNTGTLDVRNLNGLLSVGGSFVTLTGNGPFTFGALGGNFDPHGVPFQYPTGTAYAITFVPPPWGACTMTGGGPGKFASSNITATIACVPNVYPIKGTVSGLPSGVTVPITSSAAGTVVAGNGAFAFPVSIPYGTVWTVGIASDEYVCAPTPAEGIAGGTDTVAIQCVPSLYKVSVKVSGLPAGETLGLLDNGADPLDMTASGSRTFTKAIAAGRAYDVTIGRQPSRAVCAVSGGTGTVSGNVMVLVDCVQKFTVGGVVSGLSGAGLVLLDNAGDNLSVAASGSFSFATPLISGARYAVTVGAQPLGQTCTVAVSGGSGTVGSTNVTAVAVSCVANQYSVSGTITGLPAGGKVTLQDNGGDTALASSNTAFTFRTRLVSGAAYQVTAVASPSSVTCNVDNGTGTIGNADVANVAVICGATAALGGTVLGNKIAVAGAAVSVWAAGTMAQQIGASTTTDVSGHFSLSIGCPSATTKIYVIASGGNDGSGGVNPHLNLTAALGACGAIPPSIVINEVTSVAAAFALSGFANLSKVSGTAVVFQGKSPGLDNAFATLANLVTPANGVAANSSAVANASSVANVLNTLANAMGACDNSNNVGAESAACARLFSCARQNASYAGAGKACTGGNTPLPSDGLSAAIDVAQNAGLVSIAGIYDLSRQSSAYAPVLSAAPTDWTLTLAFPVTNIGAIAVDASGNVWVLGSSNPWAALFEIGPAGNFVSGANGYTGGGLASSTAFPLSTGLDNVAIDATGNVWVGGVGEIAKFNAAGQAASGSPYLVGNSLGGSGALAFDPLGNLWVGEGGALQNVVELSSAGTLMSGASGYAIDAPGLAPSSGIAVDKLENIWNVGGDALLKLNRLGQTKATYGTQVFPCGSSTCNATWSAVAIAPSGDVWLTDSANNGAAFLSFAASYAFVGGNGPTGEYTAGGILSPRALAIDASGHVWIANQDTSSTSSVTELTGNGSVLSSSVGFGYGGTLDGAQGIAVDLSGNVWVADGSGTLYELVGAGVPTKNPVVTAINTGFVP